MVAVNFIPQNQQPPRGGPYGFGASVMLQPGPNSLTDEQLVALQAHPDYARHVELGAVVVEGGGDFLDGTEATPALVLINNASTVEEIAQLPGIGEVSAGLILDAKPLGGYESIDEAKAVDRLPRIDWAEVIAWQPN